MSLSKPKNTQIVIIFVAVLLAGSTVFFYQTSASERQNRIQKEQQLSQKQVELDNTEAQIAELNKAMEDLKETSNKTVETLQSKEEALKDFEGQLSRMKKEVESLSRDKEQAVNDSFKKDEVIAEFTERLAVLQREKKILLGKQEELTKELNDLKNQTWQGSSSSAADEPYSVVSSNDSGEGIDTVSLGKIVVSKKTSSAARVQQVNPVYDFIVIDAGKNEGMKDGAIVNIVRNNTLIGKAVIRHTRPDVSAATLLPEWKKLPVQKGDLVTKL